MAKKTTKKTTAKKATSRKKTTTKKVKAANGKQTAATAAPVATETQAQPKISEEQIRRRAYEISRARKGPADPMVDWLQAETELKRGAQA